MLNIDNNSQICGRLVADPEMKSTKDGIEYATFRVAVNRGFAKQGEEKKADFFNVKAWRQSAAFVCKYFKKGQLIRVIGELQNNQYMKDDQKRDYYEIVAECIGFCGSKNDNSAPAPSTDVPADEGSFQEIDDSDLPF